MQHYIQTATVWMTLQNCENNPGKFQEKVGFTETIQNKDGWDGVGDIRET